MVVRQWTGVEICALRAAKRMGVREFAAYLGVSSRMVSNWEAAASIRPRPFNQRSLDICLERCSPDERERFALRHVDGAIVPPPIGDTVHVTRSSPGPDVLVVVRDTLLRADMRQALATRDIATVFRILARCGISQRRLAARTEQSQSEISEIRGGRKVVSYDVLVRIADNLGVPRGLMGLAYDPSPATNLSNGERPNGQAAARKARP